MDKEIKKVDIDYTNESVPQSARKGFLPMFAIMLGFTFFSASMWTGVDLANGLDLNGFILAVLIGGANLWMYKSGDEQRQDDAWEFVKFFAGDPQRGAYFSEKSGYFAGRKSAYETESYAAYLESNPGARVAINQLLDSPINTITAGANCGCMTELRQIWEQNFSNYLDGSCDLEETLEIMREEANSAIELYNEVNGLV